MTVPWNTYGISVGKASWLPDKWQWSVWHASGIDMGACDTEEDAWTKAREVARFHRALPQEGAP
jgi:hypothetical protein